MDINGQTGEIVANTPWSRRLVYIIVAVGALLLGLAMRFGLLGGVSLGTAAKALGGTIPVHTGPAPTAFVNPPPTAPTSTATAPTSSPSIVLAPPAMSAPVVQPAGNVLTEPTTSAASTAPPLTTPLPPLAEPPIIRPAASGQPFDVEVIV